jgi:hypothetical protein
MRKSITAGLTLCATLALFAGQAQAVDENAGSPPARQAHKHRQVAETPAPTPETLAPTPLFRIPAHPPVWDCVHVMFPQCSRGYEPLNDGTRGRY